MRYDNISDAKTKLAGCLAYYDSRGVYVREVRERPNKAGNALETYVYLDWLTKDEKSTMKDIIDPKFCYMTYNIGYVNYAGYATWYMRMPYRQYRQGLRGDQCEFRDESGAFRHQYDQMHVIGQNNATGEMLENKYPTFEEATKQLNTETTKVAFHKDCAVFKDPLRKDLVIEYKGIPTAFGSLEHYFKCSDDLAFLKETIKELNVKVA